jgi:hypothetical protein
VKTSSKVKDQSGPPAKADATALPKQVAQQLAEADQIQKRIIEDARARRKPGPNRRFEYKKGISLYADSEEQISTMLDATLKVIGPKKPGNKRIGRTALYGDLVQYFSLLKKHGVTLPRGGSLSLAACEHGLGNILREHGYLHPDKTDRALANSKTRSDLAHKLARIFDRVAKAVESTPA